MTPIFRRIFYSNAIHFISTMMFIGTKDRTFLTKASTKLTNKVRNLRKENESGGKFPNLEVSATKARDRVTNADSKGTKTGVKISKTP
ncbi:hypothetical protein GCM10011391_21870 [Pullulanibacillus camelliae]|uniref:Uncharacterized protein n=1 Tax=Pullulanibacillus camelliae TaxID=1707096 RepID=A0A8J3DUD7_9BACL|nr:hypothetical protein [Pullulanibacillus camelliae]GGE42707.1 hypothetical protein GCM10011391_21870 [Pullulanibacillus camelliae]